MSWINLFKTTKANKRSNNSAKRPFSQNTFQPQVEALEDRVVPTAGIFTNPGADSTKIEVRAIGTAFNDTITVTPSPRAFGSGSYTYLPGCAGYRESR